MFLKKILFLLFFSVGFTAVAQHQPEFSTAGFYELEATGRKSFSMNPAWRFFKGAANGAENFNFDDASWPVINLPNGIEYLPEEASGGINYQGEVWYRKHFTPKAGLKDKKLFLHFEAIMGKSKIYVNGKLLTEHFGGYLPVIVDVSDVLKWGEENVIAVWADNSNDPSYPPGKDQEVLDFAYFGGIYRDAWLISHNKIHITDPNYENETAGGGVLVAYPHVSEKNAEVLLKTHLRNETSKDFSGKINYEFRDASGVVKHRTSKKFSLKPNSAAHFSSDVKISYPQLWSPEHPHLYDLEVKISNNKGEIVDGYRKRIGIRSLEFKGKDGFWLNGKPYEKKIIGANRHQDFAVVGNAVPNNIHWKDAKKLRDAGMILIRNAHYPQDPAFMDAADELGLFVIVNTPGWQFWNEEPQFEQFVYQDIRNMVRRDRDRASLFLWEPILNETWYPDAFAKNTKEIVEEEFPFPNSYSACDLQAKGSEHFDILYSYPFEILPEEEPDPTKTYLTREWGDNVDDWNSHNSPSRVSRNWGEKPMLVQAQHYSIPPYPYISYDVLYKTSRQHIGGALWHPFDHQRGYHPDPFYGGIMDAYRQPKYSYYMFKAQRSPEKFDLISETGPMVYIANEMTPFSPNDVTVFSNCEEVRLTKFKDGETFIYKKDKTREGMPSPPIVFKDVYDFMDIKEKHRDKETGEVFLIAEGFIDGKLVATDTVRPALRPEKIKLWLDDENVDLHADGSDFVTVVAAITDKNGNIKRLNNSILKFEISGEGEILGNEAFITNPKEVRWGTAPILVKTTTTPGEITVKASLKWEGSQRPISGEITFNSIAATKEMIYEPRELSATTLDRNTSVQQNSKSQEELEKKVQELQQELNAIKLKEVEKQQEDFGGKEVDN